MNVVIYMLLDVHWRYKNMLFCVGNVRHELLANQIASRFKLKKFKTIWGIKLIILCIVRQPLKLQKYYAILGYDPNILLPNQFAGRFTFDLFQLLILIRESIATLYFSDVAFDEVKWLCLYQKIYTKTYCIPTIYNELILDINFV